MVVSLVVKTPMGAGDALPLCVPRRGYSLLSQFLIQSGQGCPAERHRAERAESVTDSQNGAVPRLTVHEPVPVLLLNVNAEQAVQAFLGGVGLVATSVDVGSSFVHPSDFMTMQEKRGRHLIILLDFGVITLEFLSVEEGIMGVTGNLSHGKAGRFEV